ncbi:MAG: thermonuclease family protein [Pseudomonadota bacterium]
MKTRLIIATIALAASGSANAQSLSGPATAIDGRTLDMTGTPIRLAHLDAPESQQNCARNDQVWTCGRDAQENLAQLVRGQSISCTITERDPDGIQQAICSTSDLEIGREMVRRGLAIATEYAPPDYTNAQGIARSLAFGLWDAEFEHPADWRAKHPETTLRFELESAPPSDAGAPSTRSVHQTRAVAPQKRYSNAMGCTIKGNHSRYGDWIYHLPGQRYYAQTRPEELFCTEETARAAGYRRSKE